MASGDGWLFSSMDIPRFGIPEQLAGRTSMAEQHEYLRTRLTRRGVLRTSVATAAVAGLGTALASSPAHAAPAVLTSGRTSTQVDGSLVAPFGRHLAYGAGPRTQMAVSWQVPFAVKKPYIHIGLKPWALSHRIDAEVRHLTTPELNDGKIAAVEQFYVHASLERLQPGTTYYYGVGHNGFDPADPRNLGTLGTFITAPARAEAFTFTAFGDQGVSYHALGNDQLILGQNPAFHLHAGDICYADPSGSGQSTDTYDARTWDQFLAQTETVSKTVPWMVTTGNHDMEAWYSPDGYGGQNARWTLPGNGPDPVNQPGAYSFVHGNVGVIALDANDVSYEIPANFGISDDQRTRLGRRGARRLGAALREAPGGSGHQRAQPRLRAHGRDPEERGPAQGADRRAHRPDAGRHRVRHGGRRGQGAVRLPRAGHLRGARR